MFSDGYKFFMSTLEYVENFHGPPLNKQEIFVTHPNFVVLAQNGFKAPPVNLQTCCAPLSYPKYFRP